MNNTKIGKGWAWKYSAGGQSPHDVVMNFATTERCNLVYRPYSNAKAVSVAIVPMKIWNRVKKHLKD